MTSQTPPPYTTAPPRPQPMPGQQPVLAMQAGQLVASMPQPPLPPQQKACWKGIKLTGYMQVVLGVLSIVSGIVAVALRNYLYFVGVPIWTGTAFFVVTGVLGIAAELKKATCLVIGYMVMSIIASVMAFIVIGFGGGAIVPDSGCHSFRGCTQSGRVAVDALILVVGLIEFVVAVFGASFTCACVCNLSTRQPQHVVYYQAYPQMYAGGQPHALHYSTGVPQQQLVNMTIPNQPMSTVPQEQPLAYVQGGQFQGGQFQGGQTQSSEKEVLA